MFRIILTVIITILLLPPILFSETFYNGPESAAYDTLKSRYLISNAVDGTIVEVDSIGQKSYYASGFGNCLGNCISDDVFYFTTGQGRYLHGFDLKGDTSVLSLLVTPAANIDGITADTSGYIYVFNQKTTSSSIIRVDLSDSSFTTIADGLPVSGQDLIYDPANHRILACFYTTSSPVMAINLSDYSVETKVYAPGASDGITIDGEGNVYVAASIAGCIYKFDSTFTNPVEEITCSIGWVAGPDYNRYKDVLVCPRFYANSVSYLEMKYEILNDSKSGWVPFETDFSGYCEYDVDSWFWEFGDGGTSDVQSPSHTYTTPGIYNVDMRIITTEEDTLSRTLRDIIVLADTIKADTVFGEAEETVEMTVNGNNTVPLREIRIPVEYIGNLLLVFDSVSIVGCRTESFTSVMFMDEDIYSKRFTVLLSTTGESLPVGDGALLKLYFTIHTTAKPGRTNPILFDGYTDGYVDYMPNFIGPLLNYQPALLNSQIAVPIPPCCIGQRGNVDGDELDQVDIADLVYYVEYSFIVPPGPPPPCTEEADVDANNELDVGDIVYLVEYQFSQPTGPAPLDCPEN